MMLDPLSQLCKQNVNEILEIGCGAGALALWVSQFGQRVTAIDINHRALAITELNSKINDIPNIVTIASDVYSDVDGSFDLIFSNTPYKFLPEECCDQMYAYGGYLAQDILEKIFLGLEERLNDDGVLWLLCSSYIKNNRNTLVEYVKEIFKDKPFAITLKQIDYQPLTEYREFYRQEEISHFIRYWVKVKKAPGYKLEHIQIPGIQRMVESLKIKLPS